MMNLVRFSIVTCLLVALSVSVSAGTQGDLKIPDVKYSTMTLDNGLRIFVLEDHKVPLVNFAVWYKVGSIDEHEGITGISHMLEHNMFHGTKTTEADFVHTMVKDVGGQNNAGTFFDYTMYYENVPTAKLELAVAMEADRMRNLLLPDDKFESERLVLMQERRQRVENQMFASIMEEIRALSFEQHGLHHDICGWMKDLQSITHDDLVNYYTTFYAPNNAVVIVSGDVKPQKVFDLVKQYFGSHKPQEIKRTVVTEPIQTKERIVTIEKITQVPYIIDYYRLPAGNNKDYVALQFLLTILINDPNSRINTELMKTKQNIMGAFGYALGLRDAGFCMIGFVPNSVDKIEEVKQGYEAELKKLIDNGITDEELAKVKKSILKNTIFTQKSTEAIAQEMAQNIIRYDDPEFYKKQLQWVKNITKEEIIAAAKKYLVPENRTRGIVLPKVEKKEEPVKTETDKKQSNEKKGK